MVVRDRTSSSHVGQPTRRPVTVQPRPPTCALCGAQTQSRARQVESIAHCAACGLDVCWLDGIALATHPRCRTCEVLIGAVHASTSQHNGRCVSCARSAALGRLQPSNCLDDDDDDEMELSASNGSRRL